MPRLPRLTGAELVQALKALGFVEHRQKGSHLTLKHPLTGRRAVVPLHASRTLSPKTLSGILREAGVTREELREQL